MNEKEKFCRSFEWGIDIKWFDMVGYAPIDEKRRAKICLEGRHMVGDYSGFMVSVVDKTDGPVDGKWFLFNDYLSERSDDRGDYSTTFKVVVHCGWEWYIAVPGSTRPLCAEIEKYIEIFK